jgi:hypothetical protein
MIESLFLQLDRLQRGDLSKEDIKKLKARICLRADSGRMCIDTYKAMIKFINEQEETNDE